MSISIFHLLNLIEFMVYFNHFIEYFSFFIIVMMVFAVLDFPIQYYLVIIIQIFIYSHIFISIELSLKNFLFFSLGVSSLSGEDDYILFLKLTYPIYSLIGYIGATYFCKFFLNVIYLLFLTYIFNFCSLFFFYSF